jgi:hypothetical protein
MNKLQLREYTETRKYPINLLFEGENHYEVVTLPFTNKGMYDKLKELKLLSNVTAEEFFQRIYNDSKGIQNE